jgi:mannosyltransferase
MPEGRMRAVLLGILALALGLRLIDLAGRTLWYDEAFSVLFAEKGWDAMVEGTLTKVEGGAADVHPLLYYESLDVWMKVFGEGAAAIRLYSVLVGVATVYAVFLLARDWFGEQTGLAAALITAVAPFHVQYSQETRMYALLGLCMILATWVYWRAWQRGHWGYWLAFGVLAGIGMYVQQLAGMFLVALGLLPFLARDRARIVKTGLAALLALVIYLPWMVYLPNQLGKLRQYWVQKPSILQIWLALRSFVSVNLDFSPAWWLPTYLLAAMLTVLLLYRGYAVLRSKRRKVAADRVPVAWVLWLTFMPMVLMWLISRLFQPVFLPRALLPSAIMFYCALGWLFTRGGMPRLIVGVMVTAWGIIIVFSLLTHYTWDTFPNGRFDDAASYLAGERGPADAIVHGNKITALPMIYYQRHLPQRYVRDIPGSGSDTLAVPTQKVLRRLADDCVAVAAGGAEQVWYVAFDKLEEEMAQLVEDDPANTQYDSLSWLRAHYTKSGVKRFNDLSVYRFENPDADALRATCEPD